MPNIQNMSSTSLIQVQTIKYIVLFLIYGLPAFPSRDEKVAKKGFQRPGANKNSLN